MRTLVAFALLLSFSSVIAIWVGTETGKRISCEMSAINKAFPR